MTTSHVAQIYVWSWGQSMPSSVDCPVKTIGPESLHPLFQCPSDLLQHIAGKRDEFIL